MIRQSRRLPGYFEFEMSISPDTLYCQINLN
jgi:hypothetical protein